MKRTSICSVALMVSACGEVSAAEKLCRADITEKLINPETAEFFEFKQMSREAAEAQAFRWLVRARGITENDLWQYTGAEDAFRERANALVRAFEADGATGYKSYRMKAESRVGVKATTDQLCVLKKDGCSCYSQEDFEGSS